MSANKSSEGKIFKHHKQQEYCTTRPAYRQGKKPTAVKVRPFQNCVWESRMLKQF